MPPQSQNSHVLRHFGTQNLVPREPKQLVGLAIKRRKLIGLRPRIKEKVDMLVKFIDVDQQHVNRTDQQAFVGESGRSGL
ncbi:MAG: hypothetical protein R2932_34615 [Caldilineaceae bacterium]